MNKIVIIVMWNVGWNWWYGISINFSNDYEITDRDWIHY